MKILSTFLIILVILLFSISCKKEKTNVSAGTNTFNTPDSIPPAVVLLGDNPFMLPYLSAYIEYGVYAIDSKDGDISANVVITGTIDSSQVGIDSLTYNISDAAGNVGDTLTRIVCVSYTGQQLVGTYQVVDNCDGFTYNYDISSMTVENSVFELKFINFADVFLSPVYGTIAGNTITIEQQTPIVGSFITVEGSGTITNDGGMIVMAIEFTVTTDGGPTTCNMIGTLQ